MKVFTKIPDTLRLQTFEEIWDLTLEEDLITDV